MKTWTDISLSKYCRYVLGRTIRAVYVPFEELGHDAKVLPKHPDCLFYSDKALPRCAIWHECGHLKILESPSAVATMPLPTTIAFAEGFGYSYLHPMPENEKSVLDAIQFEERVEHERRAQAWAIQEASRRRLVGVLRELLNMMLDYNWDDYPVYREAKRRLATDFEALLQTQPVVKSS